MITIPTSGFRTFILALAREHGVSAVPLPIDSWALMATCLTSEHDLKAPDEVEQSAIALTRAGIITGPEMGKLILGYLHEITLWPSTALAGHHEAVRLAVARHGGENPRVFGSVVRGEDSAFSDLDLLIDPTFRLTLITLGALQLELEALLGVPVDIVTPNGLPESIREQVLAEARPV